MMYNIYNLDHFYDFIEQEHGIEYVDMLKKFIAEHVSRETLQLQKNIELYSLGFNQALHHIDGYERITKVRLDEYDDSNILKAKRLDNKIYECYNKPNYSAEIE